MSVKRVNQYRVFLKKKLGKGSYGTVFEGENEKTGQQCAVKVIDKSNSKRTKYIVQSDPYLKDALISEIRIMKEIKCDHVVRLQDVMESKNNYYIMQELCDLDLQKYIEKQPNWIIPEKEAVQILTELCSGFLFLVKEGIVHRDLKPANIFLSKGNVKIGDFGFAIKTKGSGKIKSTVGTPLYMSLEILKGEPYTAKCDIWAIGFILYQILHGKTPWTAKSEYELINRIETTPLKCSQNLSHVTFDFLHKTLQVKEQDRISWDNLFRHPIFNGYFEKQFGEGEVLQNKYKKIMADIRFQVNSQNIHIKNLWDTLGYDPEQELNQEQFKNFIRSLVPNMDSQEEEYFLKKMDLNGDGKISLPELKSKFLEHRIPLTSKFQDKIPFLFDRIVSIDEDPDTFEDKNIETEPTPLEQKVRTIFFKLNQTMKKKKFTLFKVFNAYDRDKNGQLNLKEFSTILSRLDPHMSIEDYELIFDVVDTDKSKTISYEEFSFYFCKINGVPQAIQDSQ